MTLELKLRVPWRRDLLPVHNNNQDVIRVIKDSGSPNVCTLGNDVRVVDFFGECNRVPDVSRYHIGDDGHPFHHCDVPESQLHLQLRSIVLLVESPSVSEYQFENVNFPIAPAKGTTGENIHRCLRKVLSDVRTEFNDAGLDETALINAEHIEAKLIVPGGRRVIISNPIQFQTNLRSIHGQSTTKRGNAKWATLRDNVWTALWSEGEPGYIQHCFRARLNTYRPSLIINACTGNRTRRAFLTRTEDLNPTHGLKSLVTKFVRTKFPNVPLYEVNHPSYSTWKSCSDSSWDSREKIGLQRIYPQPNHNANTPQ